MRKVVVACRGQTYSLQPKQMVYTLPGSNYKEADLHQIHEEALQEADVALLADAWEASFCNLTLNASHSVMFARLTCKLCSSMQPACECNQSGCITKSER